MAPPGPGVHAAGRICGALEARGAGAARLREGHGQREGGGVSGKGGSRERPGEEVLRGALWAAWGRVGRSRRGGGGGRPFRCSDPSPSCLHPSLHPCPAFPWCRSPLPFTHAPGHRGAGKAPLAGGLSCRWPRRLWGGGTGCGWRKGALGCAQVRQRGGGGAEAGARGGRMPGLH